VGELLGSGFADAMQLAMASAQAPTSDSLTNRRWGGHETRFLAAAAASSEESDLTMTISTIRGLLSGCRAAGYSVVRVRCFASVKASLAFHIDVITGNIEE